MHTLSNYLEFSLSHCAVIKLTPSRIDKVQLACTSSRFRGATHTFVCVCTALSSIRLTARAPSLRSYIYSSAASRVPSPREHSLSHIHAHNSVAQYVDSLSAPHSRATIDSLSMCAAHPSRVTITSLSLSLCAPRLRASSLS